MTDRFAFAGPVAVEGRRIRGSVVLAGARTWRNNEWLEVDPAALVRADASDVMGRWEHDPGKLLGRTSNGTVRVSRTDQGISYEIDVPDTSYGNDLLELMNRGDIRGSSFEIEGLRSSFSTDPDGTRVRRITKIRRLSDVSPVTDPAFVNSTAEAFSKESDVPDIIEEPAAAPTPAEPVKPSEPLRSGKDEWAAFARDLSTEQIEGTMDQVFSAAKGDLRGELLDRYEGFAEELQRRKRESAETKARAERMEQLHNLRLGRVPKAPEAGLYESDDYRASFARYLRGDVVVMEQFAQSIAGDGSQGGYMVPDGSPTKIVETMKAYGGIQRAADTITTTDGRSLPWVTNDDTGNLASIATEGSAGSTGADLVFGDNALGAYSFDATGAGNVPLLVSKELLQDAAFDVEVFIGRKLGERLGRKMAASFATGNGAGGPYGLLNKAADVMTATTTRAASVEHVFQVDAAYRDGGLCRWIMSDTTLVKFWNATDKQGRPLFQPSAEAGGQDGFAGMLAGYPVIVDNGAGDLVAFGDIRRGFIIRYVRGVELNVDPYSNIKTRQIAYHAWARADSQVQDAAAYSVSSYVGVSADAV